MNRGGISSIVAMVLVVLITVAVTSVMWFGVYPMLGVDINSFDSSISVDTSEGYTFYDESNESVTVQIGVRGDDTPSYVQVIITMSDGTELISVHDAPSANSKIRKTFDVGDYIAPDVYPMSISVAPIFDVDGKNVLGHRIADVKLPQRIEENPEVFYANQPVLSPEVDYSSGGSSNSGRYNSGGACNDDDGDGFTNALCGGTDCDDSLSTGVDVYPDADEICDGKDNDCDGDVDESGCYVSCYQESANVPDQSGNDGSCRLTFNGGYDISASWLGVGSYDGDWGTAVSISYLPGDSWFSVTYSKPYNPGGVGYGTYWRVKDSYHYNEEDFVLPEECLDEPEVKLRLFYDASGCLSEDTLVSTLYGEKKIGDIGVGDYVLSYDEDLHLNVYSRVLDTFYYPPENSFGYYLINNDLKITGDHVVYSNGQWMTVWDVTVGYYLLDEEGNEVIVRSKVLVEGVIPLYNLDIEGSNNFYASGFLVHNSRSPSNPNGPRYFYQCYDGGDWVTLLEFDGPLSYFYEDGIYWALGHPSANPFL